MFELGIYEQLINKLLQSKLFEINTDKFYINRTKLDKEEAAQYLSRYMANLIQFALSHFTKESSVEKQIELCNKIIYLLRDEIDKKDFSEDLILESGELLNAIFKKIDSGVPDFDTYLKEITPLTRLSQSELFTGCNAGISLESEIKKEIQSSNKIHWLVSFIKWSGIRIFERELKDFTAKAGSELKILTTSYMGATDQKAVDFLASLPNTQVKISYNHQNERLHAKAYLFYRDTGFHTGYIGSSNMSRSALTSGLEWNIKITTKEIKHVIDKFQNTFETYWLDNEFEQYKPGQDEEKLASALRSQKTNSGNIAGTFFDLTPHQFQVEILEKLDAERTVHNRLKNLVVAATGTGKTIISAFDYKKFKSIHPRARLLYVAHRKEILVNSRSVFQAILKDNNFGDLYVDGETPLLYDFTFASIQTLTSQLSKLRLSPDFFDFIIIDEVHHIPAASYRPILDYFTPQILLGLTATPERMDGEDILKDFCGVIAAEIRLPEALNRKLLCPFQYFGITDSVDLSQVTWDSRKGRYAPGELTKIYTQNDRRVGEILQALINYLTDAQNVIALGFCASREHAKYMAEKFSLAGFRADYLTSERTKERDDLYYQLKNKQINYLFVVDIFNEGIDLPEIDTVLFLRPTESLTIFLQQLGRGLRLADNKECLTVIDFVGNARAEYDFESKFRALVGKTNISIKKEITTDFPHLPLGCSIILEKKTKETILKNIENAVRSSNSRLINRIKNFKHEANIPLTMKNFISFHHLTIQDIYKGKKCWTRLCIQAGVIEDFISESESIIQKVISQRWLACKSFSYFQFIREVLNCEFKIDYEQSNKLRQTMLLMLYYDFYQEAKDAKFMTKRFSSINSCTPLINELKEVIEILLDQVDFVEQDISLGYEQPLKVHARYTRDQILTAFGFNTIKTKSSIREGVAESKKLNTELLFITLKKSENDYSPTTLYNDFALDAQKFHWQSQNSATPQKGKGLSYINHQKTGKTILLFVREAKNDENGRRMGYVFLGNADYINFKGAKPMSIEWNLREPMPAYIWKESAKLATG